MVPTAHHVRPAALAAILAALLGAFPTLFPTGAVGQKVQGRVVLAGWQEKVAAATVELLRADGQPVTRAETDAEGRFSFDDVAPGAYRLRALYGDARSELVGPIRVGSGGAAGIELTLPSRLFTLARGCQSGPDDAGGEPEGAAAATGVLAGIAYDALTTTPIPGARVTVDWRGPGGAENHIETGADAAGRFVFCDVAADVPLRVRALVLGREGSRQEDVRVRPGALARLDLPMALSGAPDLEVVSRTHDRPDSLASILGTLTDAGTNGPIAGAMVGLAGHDLETVTDARGRFRIGDVPPGEHAFHVVRLGYDWLSQAVNVPGGATMVLELRAQPSAVALEAIVVRASTPESRMARGMTQAQRVIAGPRLRVAEERAVSFLEVIREFPNLEIRTGRFETAEGIEYGACIQSSRALRRFVVPEQQTSLPWCEMIAIVIDGIATLRGAEMVNVLRINNIESIELLPPLGALQYGQQAAVNGALVIWTRGRGPHADPGRRDLRRPRSGSHR